MSAAMPIVIQVNVSPGGMPKRPVPGARVMKQGLEGDRQRDRRYHGGPNRAVCLFSEELYTRLRNNYDIALAYGSVGENFTTRSIDLDALQVGDRLRVGEECLIEITDVRVPCRNLNQWNADLLKAISGHSGWVCKVVEEGVVREGDGIEVKRRGEELNRSDQ
jgi:MOSC domain-containing protein YiiM